MRIVIAVLGLAACMGCGPDARVTVVNGAGAALDSLRVVGQVEARAVRTLAPGESASVSVPLAGEDLLGLRGSLGGRALPAAMGTYVEPGYRVRLRVDSTGTVHATTRVGYP